tara:strand:- start:149 stop:466 length:318 start_codon:yes stop_codon:yes gene_type:complete
MFIRIVGTRRDTRWCSDTRELVYVGDTEDIWLLNTEYIVGMSDGIITLSCFVKGSRGEVVYQSEDTDTHSFYINLMRYHTVETEILPLDKVIQIKLLNRSKEEEQ